MKWIAAVFSIDLRSLALFRMCVAVLILVDLCLRLAGVPRGDMSTDVASSSLWQEIGHGVAIAIHLNDMPSLWKAIVTGLAAFSAVCLLFGYRSRLMALLSFLFMMLFVTNTQPVLQVAGQLLISMSLWLVFLPIGARYSVDAAVHPRYKANPNEHQFIPDQHQSYFSFASVALILQALILMLHADSLVNLFLLTLLIPSAVWIWWAKQRKPVPMDSIVIYYDEDCGFCLKMVLVLRELLLSRHVMIYPAQRYPEVYAIMERENSWVVQEPDGGYHIHWHAMQYLFAQRRVFKPVAMIMLFPPFMMLGNAIYRWIGNNRGFMSALSARLVPWRPVSVVLAPAYKVVTIGLFIAVIVHSLSRFF